MVIELEISFDKAAIHWTACENEETVAEAKGSGCGGVLYLDMLRVKGACRRQGIASRLLSRILADAKQAGFHEIQLLAVPSIADCEAALDREALEQFYAKRGFENMELHQFETAMRRGMLPKAPGFVSG